MSDALQLTGLPDGDQLRRQQGALPGAGPVRLAGPRDVHRPVGRGGARAASRASSWPSSSARAGRSRCASQSSSRGCSDEPIRRQDRARHGRREGHRRCDGGAAGRRGRPRRRRRLRRGRGERDRGADRRSRDPLRRDVACRRRGRGRGGGGDGPARHPRHLRRDHPRQPRPQDDRRRLGDGHRDAPARDVSRRADRAGAHDRSRSGAMVLDLVDVGAREPRSGELLRPRRPASRG